MYQSQYDSPHSISKKKISEVTARDATMANPRFCSNHMLSHLNWILLKLLSKFVLRYFSNFHATNSDFLILRAIVIGAIVWKKPKNSGPKSDSCGTQFVTFIVNDEVLSVFRYCFFM